MKTRTHKTVSWWIKNKAWILSITFICGCVAAEAPPVVYVGENTMTVEQAYDKVHDAVDCETAGLQLAYNDGQNGL